jgi:ATP-dependent helicase HrpA
MTGARVSDEAWAEAAESIENHLKMNIEVVDAQGKFLGEGRDLAELTARFAEASQAALAIPQQSDKPKAVEAKAFAQVAEKTQQKIAGLSMTVYPALVEEAGVVKEGRFPTQAEADFQHRRALQRLLLQQLAEQAKFLRGKLPGLTELGLLYRDIGRVEALVEDILLASLDACILDGEATLPRDGAALAQLAERKRGDWTAHAERIARLVLEILKLNHGLQKRFKGKIDLAQAMALNDIKQQLANLVYAGFVRETPGEWLKEIPRYLKAIEQRLDKVGALVQRDRVWTAELAGYWEQYKARAAKHAQEGKRDPARPVPGAVEEHPESFVRANRGGDGAQQQERPTPGAPHGEQDGGDQERDDNGGGGDPFPEHRYFPGSFAACSPVSPKRRWRREYSSSAWRNSAFPKSGHSTSVKANSA